MLFPCHSQTQMPASFHAKCCHESNLGCSDQSTSWATGAPWWEFWLQLWPWKASRDLNVRLVNSTLNTWHFRFNFLVFLMSPHMCHPDFSSSHLQLCMYVGGVCYTHRMQWLTIPIIPHLKSYHFLHRRAVCSSFCVLSFFSGLWPRSREPTAEDKAPLLFSGFPSATFPS